MGECGQERRERKKRIITMDALLGFVANPFPVPFYGGREGAGALGGARRWATELKWEKPTTMRAKIKKL